MHPRIIFLSLVFLTWTALPAGTNAVLRTTADVRTHARAVAPLGIPVELGGQVTAELYKKGIILFDATGGCYIENLQNIPEPKPHLGDHLTVRGETFANEFRQEAVKATHITITGHSPAPAPLPTTVERIVSGAENFKAVRISGYITEVIEDEINPEWHYMVLSTMGPPPTSRFRKSGKTRSRFRRSSTAMSSSRESSCPIIARSACSSARTSR